MKKLCKHEEIGEIEKAIGLAEEICFIYNELIKIIPDVSICFKNEIPDWLPLTPQTKATIQHYILENYAANLSKNISSEELIKLAISFPINIDTPFSPIKFHISHFYPLTLLMENINLLTTNQKLLHSVKHKLAELLTTEIAGKIIPEDPNCSNTLMVTGLKNIYFNYPGNLCIKFGAQNNDEQNTTHFQSAIEKLIELYKCFLSATEEDILDILKNFLQEDDFTYSESDGPVVTHYANCISNKFNNYSKKIGLLPLIQINNTLEVYFLSESEFFSKTAAGIVTNELCSKVAQSATIIVKELRKNTLASFGIFSQENIEHSENTLRTTDSIISQPVAAENDKIIGTSSPSKR